MKESIKRIILSICAISLSAVLVSATATATERRSQPGDTTTTSQSSVVQSSTSQNSSSSSITSSAGEEENSGISSLAGENSVSASTQPSAGGVVVNDTTSSVATQNVTETSNKKYLSKFGGFLWFLLSVIVNFIISCWVGNRFYKLSKKSTQTSAEIRALRKDIEEKFASTIHDISEPALEVVNSNDNYSRTDEGISMPNRQPKVEITDEEREILKKWDSRQSKHEEPEHAHEYTDEFEDEGYERSFRSYQPTRSSSGIVFADEDEQYEEETAHVKGAAKKEKGIDISKAKNKAKNIFNNIFPFDEQ